MSIESKLFNKKYYLKFSDRSTWAVPVHLIMMNHAEYVAGNNGQDPMVALEKETIPFFEEDDCNIEYWAKNNMNWGEVKDLAVQITPPALNFQSEWINSKVKIAP